MLTVPVVDATAAGAPQYGSPGVAPVRNAAPEQMQNLGQTLQQIGGAEMRAGGTIGDRVQMQVDDAKTKGAEATFLSSAQTILNDPTNGYFRQQGKNAVDQYQPSKEAIATAGQTELDKLDNPLQKQMFQQVLQQHLLNFGKSMADYNHGQSVAWSASESKARSDSYTLMALSASDSRYQTDETGSPLGDFAKYTQQMEAEVLNVAHLSGFDPDSAQAKSMLREQYTSLNQAMIAKMLDNHDAAGAKKWFDEQSAKGNIDIRNLTSLGNAVKGEYDRQMVNTVAQDLIAASLSGGKAPTTLTMPVPGSSINVTSGLGMARSNGRTHDGIDIVVPVGTSVMAPASGKVLKVWNDDKNGGGLSVEMQLPNGYVAGFAHLSAANVHVGDEIQQGTTLGLSGRSGNATGPVLHYMMKDADNKYVDPRQVSQPQPNREGFADPNALESALKSLQSRTDLDPAQKRQAATILESEHSHAREIENQKQTQIYKQASDAFYGGGMNTQSIQPSLFSQLTPEQQQKFKDEQTSKVMRDYSQSQFFKERGEIDIVSQFIQNPEQLTTEHVEMARSRLSDSTYLSFMRQAEAQAQNPKGVVEAQGVQDQLKSLAVHAGINIEPKTPADKQTWIDLNARVQQDIDQIKTQNNGKATQEQVQKAIQQELIRRTVSTPRSPWNPLALFSPNKTVQVPLGAVQTVRGSDNKLHYIDRNNLDLGLAE